MNDTTDAPGPVANVIRIGVLSDTHGHLSPKVAGRFMGVDAIVHAGDIGPASILRELEKIAPVTAVKGNCDFGEPSLASLNTAESLEFGNLLVYVLHDLDRLDISPEAAGVSVVISGHTHRAMVSRRSGVTYVNPGSAWRSRDDRGPSVALVTISGPKVSVEAIGLV